LSLLQRSFQQFFQYDASLGILCPGMLAANEFIHGKGFMVDDVGWENLFFGNK
jgi:hypothetical protein